VQCYIVRSPCFLFITYLKQNDRLKSTFWQYRWSSTI
jgi:hypothetical protein